MGDPPTILLHLATSTAHAPPLSMSVAPLYPMPMEGGSGGVSCACRAWPGAVASIEAA